MNKEQSKDWKISPGKPYPFGATPCQNGVNFALAAREAQKVNLALFDEAHLETPIREIELDPKINRTGHVWHIHLQNLPPFTVYGYRVFPDIKKNDSYLLLDPYAKIVPVHQHGVGTSTTSLTNL